MALQLNLLHEEISEQRQRQRDPLKIGTLVLVVVALIMVAFYMWKGYKTLEVKRRLATVQADWAKVEPTVTSAQKRSKELNGIINTTKVLDTMVEGRFYWAPLLDKVSRCIAPNAQLISIDGFYTEATKTVMVTVEGVAAGREPRGAAEEFRQLLNEQLSQDYGQVAVQFNTLEDLDTAVNVAGAAMSMARFGINMTFNPVKSAPAATASPAAARAAKQ